MDLVQPRSKSPQEPVSPEKTGILFWLAGAWLLCGFLLPNTFWGRISPMTPTAAKAAAAVISPSLWIVWLLACTAFFGWYLVRPAPNARSGFLLSLWVWTGTYIGLFVFQAISLTLSRKGGANPSIGVLLPLFCGLVAARLCRSRETTLRLVTLLAIIQALYALVSLKSGVHVVSENAASQAGGTFDDPDSLSLFVLIGLPYALLQAIRGRSSASLFGWGAGAAVLIASLLTARSPGGLTAAVAGIGFLSLSLPLQRRVPVGVRVALVTLAVGATLYLPQGNLDLPLRLHTMTQSNAPWRQELSVFTTHFWSGIGLGTLDLADSRVSLLNGDPGNLPVAWLLELGIGGGVLFGLFCFTVFRLLKSSRSETTLALSAAWLSLLCVGLIGVPFGSAGLPCGNVLFAVLLGASLLPEPSASSAASAAVVSMQKEESKETIHAS